MLEEAVEDLPEPYRTVFMLRDVEEMSTSDAAYALDITEQNVKVRLHRARALLRRSLFEHAGAESAQMFTFHAVRCNRVVNNVFERIESLMLKTGSSGQA
jgi:RNA polymerase sigma-70 factor (ECF subfamily)